jgi:hypothetical protein
MVWKDSDKCSSGFANELAWMVRSPLNRLNSRLGTGRERVWKQA